MVEQKKFRAINKVHLLIPLLLLLSLLQPVSPTQADDPPPPELPEITTRVFLPIAQKPSSNFVSNIELTQAVQNLSSPVPLVAGRPTVARVYVRTLGSTQVSGIRATLKAYRNGNLLGEKTLTNGTAYPQSVSLDTLRASASKSMNFSLEPAWISAGTTSLVVELGSSLLGPDSPVEATFTTMASFNSVPAVTIMAVPIQIYDQSNGRVYPADSTAYLQEAIFRMYPVPSVNISVHSTFNYTTYSFGTYASFSGLLDAITNLKETEGQPSATVYFGVIPLTDNSGNSWIPYFGSFYAGIGWVGYRAAIGISNETAYGYYLGGNDTASHEIGHNFGRWHSPGCGAGNTDPNYPYLDGTVGHFGFKVSELPTQVVTSSSLNDIMNYCNDQWLSDYTYLGLYQNQVAAMSEVSLPEQDTVYIRAALEAGGAFDLKPVYSFKSSPQPAVEESEYAVQFLDEAGQVVAQHPVKLLHAEEYDIVINTVGTRLPAPDKPYAAIRLVKNGQELAARSLSPETQAQVSTEPSLVQTADSLTLTWDNLDQPALIRYSADGGKTWTTLGIDFTGDSLALDTADLPAGPLQFQVTLADGGGSYTIDRLP